MGTGMHKRKAEKHTQENIVHSNNARKNGVQKTIDSAHTNKTKQSSRDQ
jgi:hypothetical protein